MCLRVINVNHIPLSSTPKLVLFVRLFVGFATIGLLLVGFASPGFAQKSDTDNLLKEANKLFENGQYAEAYPLFTQLLSVRRGDPDITFKYGATLLYGSEKKADAIPYLKKASLRSSTDVRVFYFLGRSYHLNYEFDKATEAYANFKAKADAKLLEEFDVDLLLDQCKNGKQLLSQIKDVLVIDRKDVDSKEFFRYYELDNLAGKVLVAPEVFQTSIDKKKGHRPIIYSTALSNVVYFSSYGKKGDRGRDIYFATRRGDDSWSDPILLPSTINTEYNEDYPFMHPDGKTLYFCSEGHNSMGGFDIFRSVININNGMYSSPENLDFAINTPDDDLFYIADSLNQNAFFSSARASKQDRLSVYEVKVDLVPSSVILLKGQFLSEIDPSLKDARITIEDAQTKRQIGVYSTENNGSYLLDFTYGGAYNFYVEPGESGVIHTGKVEIPRLESITAFRQELVMIDNNGKEMLMIKNYFEEELEEDAKELLAIALRKRADLGITPKDIIDERLRDQEAQQAAESFDDLFIAAGLASLHSNEGVLEWSEKIAIELEDNNEEYRALSSNAYAEYDVFQEEADKLIVSAQEKYAQFENSDDPLEKQEALKASITLRNEAKVKLLNSSSSMMISKHLNESIDEREKLISEFKIAEDGLRKGLDENDAILVQSSLKEINLLKVKSKDDIGGTTTPVNYIAGIKEIEKKKALQAFDRAEDLRSEKNEQVTLLMRLQTQHSNAKKSDKERLAGQITETQGVIDRIDEELPQKWEKYRVLDWNSKVAEKGLDYATNWDYTQGFASQPIDEQIVASGNNILTAKESISSMEELESEALISLGISYEELMSKDASEFVSNEEKNEDAIELDGDKTASFENSFVSDYDSKIESIENNPVVIDRLEASILLKAEVLREVNRNLENNTTNYSYEELGVEKTRLEEETVLMFDEFKQIIENQQETSLVVNDFIPDYDQQVEEIENISNTDLENKSNRIKLYNSTIGYLNVLLDSLNMMPVSEYDPFLMRQQIDKLNALKIIITELKIERYEMQKNVEVLGKIAEIPNEYEMIVSIDESYHQKMEIIENSDSERDDMLAKKIQLNESLIAKINGEIFTVNNEISNSEAQKSPILDKRLEILEAIKLEKENEINDSVMKMAMGAETDDITVIPDSQAIEKSTIEKKDLIALLMPEYEQEKTAIEFSDMPDDIKQIKMQEINLDLSKAVDLHIAEMDEAERTGEEYNSWLALQNELKEETKVISPDVTIASTEEAEIKEIETLSEVETDLGEKSVDTNSPNIANALVYASTTKAMDLYSKEGKIALDPGFTSANLKSEARQYHNEISSLNSLKDQYAALELKRDNSTDKEKKKINKELDKLNSEITDKEIDLLTKWIPLIHVENEDNPSDDSYLELSKQLYAEAENLKDEEKLSALNEAYFLSLLALEANQSRDLVDNPSSLIPLSKSNQKGFNYDNLLVDEKRLVLEMNIRELKTNILEAETKVDELRNSGMSETDTELMNWVEISKSYQEALVWNQSKLEDLHSLESEIALQSEKKVSAIKAPTGKDAFAKSLGKIGLNDSQVEIITSDPEIQTYFAMKYKENEVESEVNKLIKMRSAYRDEADQALVEYNQFGLNNASNSDDAISNYEEKESVYQKALLLYNKTDSIDLVIMALEKEQIALNNDIDTYYDNLESINKQTISDIKQGITPLIVQEEAVAITESTNEDPTNNIEQEAINDNEPIVIEETVIDAVPTDGSSDGFMYEAGIVFYSNQDPIPVNPPLPQGLIFKVQIGAFRNPLPVEHFVGLSPMMAEKLSNGITRYSVGIFNDINDARQARLQVRGLGYNDAFIVAFLNGERIAMNEALAMIGESSGAVATNDGVASSNVNNESVVRNADLVARSNTNENSTPDRNTELTSENEAPATAVSDIDHLFFCVQVGVYSKKIKAEDIFEIRPLNIERTGSGYYRYTSGQFSSLSEAGSHKQHVISKGISDAFVTAYYQGQRISIDRASALLEQDPSILIASTSPTINRPEPQDESIVEDDVSQDVEPIVISEPISTEVDSDLPPAEDVKFVIYIGSYPDNIPNNVAAALLEYSNVGIKRVVNSGNTIYSTKVINTFNEATILLQNFQERGIEQAKMLYVLNGNEIDERRAYQILDQ